MDNLHEEKVFTQEELDAKRKDMLKFYKDSLPYLKAQHDYEELLMKIDEVRFKRTNIQMQFAMMAQAQQEAEAAEGSDTDIDKRYHFEDEDEDERPVRKLKKQ